MTHKPFARRWIASLLVASVGLVASAAAHAAGTAIVTGETQGITPFIGTASATVGGAKLASVIATIQPVAGSHTRPMALSYSAGYLTRAHKFDGTNVTIPLTFLYANQTNTISLLFRFTDGSSVATSATITTPAYSTSCAGLVNPNIQQNRTTIADIGFDYFVLKDYCSGDSPAIVDTDGNARWVATAHVGVQNSIFYKNAVYASNGGTGVNRIDLDGTVTRIAEFSSLGVTGFHHNIDPGRNGLIIDVNTTTQTESVNIEFDPKTGAVLNRWDLADIITAAMVAGGDDPSGFVYSGPDWFHNNAVTYNKADNTLVLSSRENFVIAVDYDAPASGVRKIHWILGDPTKHWHQYPSLQKYALTLTNTDLYPIGQHAVSIDHLGNVLLFNDGGQSFFQTPAGQSRSYSIAQSFKIDAAGKTATQVFNYTDLSKLSYICGSVYEGTPGEYLVDYSQEQAGNTEIRGLGYKSRVIFDIKYPLTGTCAEGWNANVFPGHRLTFQ